MAPPLTGYVAAQTALGAAIAIALLVVARMTVRQTASSRFPTAARMFSLWWAGLGLAWLAWAADTLLVHLAEDGRGAALLDYGLIIAYFMLVIMAFASLFYYLLFLYVGSARLSWTVWTIYGVLTLLLLALLLVASPPTEFHLSGLYATTLFGEYSALADVLRAILLVPVIVAALALFWVSRRVADPLQRYRVLLVSSALAFYLLMPLFFGSNPGVEPETAAGWAREILNKAGLFAAVGAALMAYHPPAWVRRRIARRTEEALG